MEKTIATTGRSPPGTQAPPGQVPGGPHADMVVKRQKTCSKWRSHSRCCGEAVSSLASPSFDSSLVQGASRLRYADEAQMQRPGDMPQMALAHSRKKRARACSFFLLPVVALHLQSTRAAKEKPPQEKPST